MGAFVASRGKLVGALCCMYDLSAAWCNAGFCEISPDLLESLLWVADRVNHSCPACPAQAGNAAGQTSSSKAVRPGAAC